MTDIPPAIRALIEGKNAELKQMHLNARIGDLQGSRVQAVRDILDGWAPQEGTALHVLWSQIDTAIRQDEAVIETIRQEAHRDIPGIDTGAPRD